MSLSTAANWATIISVLPLLAIVGAAYHHLNCQEPGCMRLGHPSRGHYCRKHAKSPITTSRSTEAAPRATGSGSGAARGGERDLGR